MKCFITSFLLALLAPHPIVEAVPPDTLYPSRFTTYQPPPTRPWTRFRNAVIQKVFGVSIHETNDPVKRKQKFASPMYTRYGDDAVLRFNITTGEEVAALRDAANSLLLDVWEYTSDWVDIRLAKQDVPDLLDHLPPSLHDAHTPLMFDLAHTVFETYPAPTRQQDESDDNTNGPAFSPVIRPNPPSETNIFFKDYQPLSVIRPWMRLMASLFPTHVRMINIGISYEGRDIPALRVGVHPTNSDQPSERRKTIIVMGGSHAREWIGVSTVNYVAYSLITSYGKSKGMTKLLEEFDWVFIPTLNPDGYVYTWEYDRLWRKNRQQTDLRFCRGVDLDRSYGFEWDGESTRSNPCSESFAGAYPFEAVESRRLADWAKNETANNDVKFVGFLDLHSYSQQILYPYSFSCSIFPPTLENLQELGMNMAKAIRLTNRVFYGVSSACEGSVAPSNDKFSESWPRIESSAGSALDWFYHDMGVRYAYQLKLRDEGAYGFLLPRENIVPTGREIFNAIVEFGDFLLGNNGIERGSSSSSSSSSTSENEMMMMMGARGEDDVDEPGMNDNDKDGSDEKEEVEEVSFWELRRRRRR